MGKMNLAPLGEHFFAYFPIILLLLCIAHVANFWTNFLAECCAKRFKQYVYIAIIIIIIIITIIIIIAILLRYYVSHLTIQRVMNIISIENCNSPLIAIRFEFDEDFVDERLDKGIQIIEEEKRLKLKGLGLSVDQKSRDYLTNKATKTKKVGIYLSISSSRLLSSISIFHF